VATGKSKEKAPSSAKRPSKKKPKDKPKRPLSAYNFFFKEEREKILKVVLAEEPSKVDNDPDSDDFLDEAALGRLRKEGGKVSFEEMGKIIGQRWKNIEPDRMNKFSELAAEDTERYKKEMQSYNGRQEAKMRSEALKPPANFSRPDMQRPPVGGQASAAAMGGMGYDMSGMNSAFGNPAAAAAAAGMAGGYNPYSGGMEFMSYPGMQAMYGAYGGYPGMGAGGMGGGSPDGMGQAQGMDPNQYNRMYGMMGGGMMGYGGGQPGDYGQGGMDPVSAQQAAMYGGYGGPQGWGQQ
jgi:hypothetical protein